MTDLIQRALFVGNTPLFYVFQGISFLQETVVPKRKQGEKKSILALCLESRENGFCKRKKKTGRDETLWLAGCLAAKGDGTSPNQFLRFIGRCGG